MSRSDKKVDKQFLVDTTVTTLDTPHLYTSNISHLILLNTGYQIFNEYNGEVPTDAIADEVSAAASVLVISH